MKPIKKEKKEGIGHTKEVVLRNKISCNAHTGALSVESYDEPLDIVHNHFDELFRKMFGVPMGKTKKEYDEKIREAGIQ